MGAGGVGAVTGAGGVGNGRTGTVVVVVVGAAGSLPVVGVVVGEVLVGAVVVNGEALGFL